MKLKFNHTNNWYTHEQEPVLENETHKVLRDIQMQTDLLMSARWPNQVIVNKEKKGEPAE